MPAMSAFWVSSNEARPDTMSTVPRRGSRPLVSAHPTTLSTALWRPTSSRSTRSSPVAPSNSPAACSPPVLANTSWCSRSRSGNVASRSAGSDELVVVDRPVRVRADGVDAGLAAQPAGRRRVEGALEAGVRRGDAAGQRDVEDVVGVEALVGRAGAVPRRDDVLRGRDDALRHEEPGRELDVVAGRPHGDGERPSADADLEGLLRGEDVLDPARPAVQVDPRHPSTDRDSLHAPLSLVEPCS